MAVVVACGLLVVVVDRLFGCVVVCCVCGKMGVLVGWVWLLLVLALLSGRGRGRM